MHQLTGLRGLPKLQQEVFPFGSLAQSAAAVQKRIANRPVHTPVEPGETLPASQESTHAEVNCVAVQLGTAPPLKTMAPQQICEPHPPAPEAPGQSTAYNPAFESQEVEQLAARVGAFTQQCSPALQK
jgi:hypothetical protein